MSLQPTYILTILYQTETGGSGGWWLFLIGLVALVGFLYWFRQVSEEDLEERTYLEENYPAATAMPAGFTLPETAVVPAAHDDHHDHHGHDDHHH